MRVIAFLRKYHLAVFLVLVIVACIAGLIGAANMVYKYNQLMTIKNDLFFRNNCMMDYDTIACHERKIERLRGTNDNQHPAAP